MEEVYVGRKVYMYRKKETEDQDLCLQTNVNNSSRTHFFPFVLNPESKYLSTGQTEIIVIWTMTVETD